MSKTVSQRVLVSFIGKGIRAEGSPAQVPLSTHTGYRTAHYSFSVPDYQSKPTSLFGIALIRYLESQRKLVDRWLVLGSPQSNWDALFEVVPEEYWDSPFETIHARLQSAVREEEQQSAPDGQGKVTQELLDEWSHLISEKIVSPKIECRLIGWSDSVERQMKLWQILNERIPPEAELILDITHGFRHQPMLLATMVVLMSHLKQFKSVELYYGALDMPKQSIKIHDKRSQQETPVNTLRIELFPELLECVRRVGVLQIAGEYESLGKYLLRSQPEMKKELEELAFKERANLDVPKDQVDEFVTQLEQWQPEDPVRDTLKPILLGELKKHHAETPWERAAQRADEAIKHHDYLTAYTLLWEATVSVSVLITQPDALAQIDNTEVRSKPIEKLLQHNYILQSEANTLHAFRTTRNWMVHGTRQRDKKAEHALKSPENLRALYAEARQIFNKLMTKIPESSQQSQPTSTDGA